MKAEIKRRLYARGRWQEAKNPKKDRTGWSHAELWPGGTWNDADEDSHKPHYTVMMDQSTDRYRILLTDEPGYNVWKLEQWLEPIMLGDEGGYGNFAEGDSAEELEGALAAIIRADLRQLRRSAK
jgi:hypothetical protein